MPSLGDMILGTSTGSLMLMTRTVKLAHILSSRSMLSLTERLKLSQPTLSLVGEYSSQPLERSRLTWVVVTRNSRSSPSTSNANTSITRVSSWSTSR